MNKAIRIIVTITCTAVLLVSWVIAVSSKTTAEKQLDLIAQARLLIDDEIYILAVPLLEEAAGYDAKHTPAAEEELKRVYLALIDKRGFSRKYISLLEKQMLRRDASPEVFAEAASYRLSMNETQEALTILRTGITETGDAELKAMYESARYAYEINRTAFDEVTAIYNKAIQVRIDDRWGIANMDGSIAIPCLYDKVSTFYQNRAIVMKDGLIYAVDKDNNRVAVAPGGTWDFRNLSDNRAALLSESGWRRATPDFELGTKAFEDIGMYSGGYAAARIDGKWGVIGIGNDWLIPAQYDEIIQDELGRCYAQGAVFVRSGESVYLFVDGRCLEGTYQDAQPFSGEGYAAVKRDDKWGFIDTAGNTMIDFAFDNALSFGGHLAAVKKDEMWGYVSIAGDIVIDTVFLEAKSFDGGTAPVLTERGWQLITLIEYKKERILG